MRAVDAPTEWAAQDLSPEICRHYVKGHGKSEGPVLIVRGGSHEGGERKLPAFQLYPRCAQRRRPRRPCLLLRRPKLASACSISSIRA